MLRAANQVVPLLLMARSREPDRCKEPSEKLGCKAASAAGERRPLRHLVQPHECDHVNLIAFYGVLKVEYSFGEREAIPGATIPGPGESRRLPALGWRSETLQHLAARKSECDIDA